MKRLICGPVLFLMGCTTTSSPNFAPASLAAGYPIFITSSVAECRYGVQDMIFIRNKDLADWMNDLPNKSRQIDLVVEDERNSCASHARKISEDAGFKTILLRKRGDVTYPSGLPPT